MVVVDKPAGISSAGVVAILKRMFRANKVGHAGTLDPFATGVLVCCINKATRLADFFLKSRKIYRAVMVLGVATDTQDATGSVISRNDPGNVSTGDMEDAFLKFTGIIHQHPPVFSALKHKGQPLYKLARRGEMIQKPPRQIHIHRLDILDVDLPEVRFEADCSAGTYVRTLCADIGAELGFGGHLKDLRRLKSGGFTIGEAATLDELESAARNRRLADRMIGMADALKGMPGCVANDALIEKLVNGKTITREAMAGVRSDIPTGFFKIVDTKNRLIAVLSCKEDRSGYDYRCVFPE